MKNINITREEAINKINNLIQRGYCVPMASLGNGGAGFGFIDSNTDMEALNTEFKDTDLYDFRVVPESEIADDLDASVCLDNYDVCVEFASIQGDNAYREQYLLWDE